MKFPMVGDISSKSVIKVDSKEAISKAISIMLEHDHRNIIVIDKDIFRILTVINIIKIKTKKIDLESSLKSLNLPILHTIHKDKNILDTLDYVNSSIEYMCVVNDDNSLYGLLTHTDITTSMDPDTLMENLRLNDFLKVGQTMEYVDKDVNTESILNSMVDNAYDNVVVVENKKPIGILTTKDAMRLIKTKESLDVPVSVHMSSPVDSININSTIKDALSFLKDKHYKRVIVVENNGEMAGIITQKELISLTYTRWASLMKEYQEELSEINNLLENKNKEYEIMASTDSLTGLYNRHKFSELYISSYVSMLQRNNDMSIILLDIDFFKKVNDTYGHNGGDKVLVEMSKTLSDTMRNIDVVCRWGGEEFIILLPTASLDIATLLAEKLRKNIEELEIDVVGNISASFGVSYVVEGDDMNSAIARADEALYLAKDSGRNCVKTELDL